MDTASTSQLDSAAIIPVPHHLERNECGRVISLGVTSSRVASNPDLAFGYDVASDFGNPVDRSVA